MYYQKRPVTIQAFQWTGDETQTDDPVWMVKAIKMGKVEIVGSGTEHVHLLIHTLEGVMKAVRGDYVVLGLRGELYPVRPDIFAESYQPSVELNEDGRYNEKANVYFDYTNYKGVRTVARKVYPLFLFYGSTEYYPKPQWLLNAYDFGRQAVRTFAVNKIENWRNTPEMEGRI